MKNSDIFKLLFAVIIIAGSILYLGEGKARPRASDLPLVELGIKLPSSGGAANLGETEMIVNGGADGRMLQSRDERVAEKERRYERAKELVSPSGFVNTKGASINLADYVGEKVILLDIMTYSCVNCVRTFPYVNGWYEKYKDEGLVVIGIHTPEFEFEKDKANVEAAMKKYGIEFPVVLDNDYGTWNAYRNLYWPRKYLIDIDGFIRYDHIGEGGYAQTESAIQELLRERAKIMGENADVDFAIASEPTPSSRPGQSPETYFGSARNEYLGNGKKGVAGPQDFIVPSDIVANTLYLGGLWKIDPEHAEASGIDSSITYRFYAKNVYIVASAEAPVNVEVLVDGKPLGEFKGSDIKEVQGKSILSVSGSRLYEIYLGAEMAIRTIELRPESKGFKAFAFTFGS